MNINDKVTLAGYVGVVVAVEYHRHDLRTFRDGAAWEGACVVVAWPVRGQVAYYGDDIRRLRTI